MASTALQFTPLLVSRHWERGCVGETATTTLARSNNSGSKAVVAARFPGAGFDKAALNGGGRREGEPVAVMHLSRSSFVGSSVDSPQHRRTEVLGQGSRPPRMQAAQAIPGNVEMLESYEIERKVRDYELDHYGVVNNAIYAQFCQQARTELLENIGFHPDGVTESGRSMAIADMTMKFVSPLRSGDRYVVSSRVAGTTAVRLIFEDHIYRLPDRQLVMTARSTVVVLDQNAKPGRLPDEIKIKLVAGYSTNCQAKSTTPEVKNAPAPDHVNGKSRTRDVDGTSASGHIDSTTSSATEQALNGYALNGYVNGTLVKGYVNGSNSMEGLVINGNLVEGTYLNGSALNSYATGNSVIDPVTVRVTSDHVNGSTDSTQATSEEASSGHLNSISSHSHLIANSATDSGVSDQVTDLLNVNGDSPSGGQANAD